MKGRVAAVVLAGGKSKRLGEGQDKLLLPLMYVPVLARSLEAFQGATEVDEIVLVAARASLERYRGEIVERYGFDKVSEMVAGGPERQDSAYRGLMALGQGVEIVLIHDGARPLVEADVIRRVVETARRTGAAVPAVRVTDTIKMIGGGGDTVSTLERERLWRAQTPQGFRRELIEEAYREAYRAGYLGTDDSSLVERLGHPVALVPGSEDNLKITTYTDLVKAEALLMKRGMGSVSLPPFSVGFGYDCHRLVPGRRLVLGGVTFPGEAGLEGHSDADVVVHAVMDALLGAAGERDIGWHFPDRDDRYKDASSVDLLRQVGEMLKRKGYRPANIDCTLLAESPRISDEVPQMQRKLSGALGISEGQVSIKATTAEGLGYVGRREGMAAMAVATLYRAGIF